jgi:valyl-tRNA synthetase
VKYRLYGEKDEAALYTLYHAFLAYLKFFSPYMAHITEELYQIMYAQWEDEKSIHLSAWPEGFDVHDTTEGQIIVDIISTLRRWKSDNGIPLNRELKKITLYTDVNLGDLQDIHGAMNISQVELSADPPTWTEKISHVSPNFRILGPLFGKDTPRVAELLKKNATDLENSEELSVEGFTLKREYIASLEKEFFAGEKKVEVLSSGDVIIEIEV